MLPSSRFQRLRALRCEQGDGRPAFAGFHNAADSGHRDAGNRAGQASDNWGSEEQFVVLAAIERLIQCRSHSNGNERGIDLGGDARLSAQVSQIAGEAVAHVEGGRGQPASLQPKPLCDARLRIEMRGELLAHLFGDAQRVAVSRRGHYGQPGKSSGGSAEGAGHVELVDVYKRQNQKI